MTNVLIVDDEPIERESLALILTRHFPDLQVKQARNGRAAIELVSGYTPDLVFMDIQMPGMSGLEAIEILRPMLPETKFIMVTAFATFEYAQQAMKLGVTDYMVKPSKISEIIKTAENMLQRIEKEKASSKKTQSTMEKAMAIFETDVVTQLLFDHVHDVHLTQLVELLDTPVTDEKFVLNVLLSETTLPCYSAIKKTVRQNGSAWVGALNGQQVPVIVFRNGQSFRQQATSLARELLRQCPAGQNEWMIGISNVCNTNEAIKHAYQEALVATRTYHDGIHYQFYEDAPKPTLDFHSASYKGYEQTFYELIRHDSWNEIVQKAKSSLQKLEHEGVPPIQAQKQWAELLWLLSSILNDMGVEVALPIYTVQASSFQQLRTETVFHLEKLQEAHSRHAKRVDGDIIEQLKQYIVDHAHEDLSLEMISSKVGLSPIYLSKLFKKKLGINYITFLTECRLEKAKKLMRDSEKSLKEIAIDVGYHDPNYFSKVFRKAYNIAPTDYRKQTSAT